jgi:hypothetical protein
MVLHHANPFKVCAELTVVKYRGRKQEETLTVLEAESPHGTAQALARIPCQMAMVGRGQEQAWPSPDRKLGGYRGQALTSTLYNPELCQSLPRTALAMTSQKSVQPPNIATWGPSLNTWAPGRQTTPKPQHGGFVPGHLVSLRLLFSS